ncbi:MAG: HEAT repeat domain-containing protein [Planctomycetota bacterium]
MRVVVLLLLCGTGAYGDELEELRSRLEGDDVRAALRDLGARNDVASIPAIAGILRAHPDIETRRLAAHALGKLRPATKQSVAALRAALADRMTREAATKALGQLGPAAAPAIPDLIASLHLRYSGGSLPSYVLAEIGEAAVPALLTTFQGPHESARRYAADALARMGGAGVVALLLHAEDEQPKLREEAIRALALHAAPTPVIDKALRAAARDGQATTRFFALVGLVKRWKQHADLFVTGLHDRDHRVRGLAARTLREGGHANEAVAIGLHRALELDLIAHGGESTAETVRATLELKLALPKGVPMYVRLLEGTRPDGAALLASLGERGDAARPALRAFVSRWKSEPIRAGYAMRAWGAVGMVHPDAPALLRAILLAERARHGLGFAQECAAAASTDVEALIVLASRTQGVVTEPSHGPGIVGWQRVDDDRARFEHLPARIAAVRALQRCGNKSAVEPLLSILGSAEVERWHSGVPAPKSFIDESPGFEDLIDSVRGALAALDVDVEPQLVQRLREGEVATRRGAVVALDRMQASAPPTLEALLAATDDRDRTVRYRALARMLQSHKKLGFAVPRLRRALKSTDAGVRSMAIRILSRIDPEPPTARALVALLHDRGIALSAFGEPELDRSVGDVAYAALRGRSMFHGALPELLAALDRDDPLARKLLWEKAEHGGPYTLAKILDASNEELRRTAARSLPRQGPTPLRTVRKQLESHRDDDDPVVRENVRKAIASIRTP